MHKQYRITWAPGVIVTAENETEAWAKFCDGNEEARKHPKMYPQIIEEVLPEPTPVEHSIPVHIVDGPVDQLPANEAIDQISRMRSRDRLKEIVASDQRPTVVQAARKRLTEIPE